ncbi:MAG: DMT family transporter [Eubacteriales bacterium]|nr:DMT family transporter [Eubacteriales bacterium]MDD4323607.1 DMT family transporter [Eubacteriales bacterium]MDD4540759.1 DMT family transporter [Eubacteriales bacterium]
MTQSKKAHLMLLLTAFLWGMTFVAQSAGLEHVGPFTFNALRYGIGVLVLIPLIIARKPSLDRKFLKAAVIIGLLLFVSSSLQQIALQTASAGKAGFITSLYIVFVPIISQAFGKKVNPRFWLAVAIAVAGLFLMTFGDSGKFGTSDILLLLGAVGYSFHILAIAKYAGDVDPIALSASQFLIASVLSFIPALLFENMDPVLIRSALSPILYAGVFSCGVAYTLQIVAQKHSQPTVASMIMSLEAVFAAIGGALILGQMLSVREIQGSVLTLASVFYVQYLENKETSELPEEVEAESDSASDEAEAVRDSD